MLSFVKVGGDSQAAKMLRNVKVDGVFAGRKDLVKLNIGGDFPL